VDLSRVERLEEGSLIRKRKLKGGIEKGEWLRKTCKSFVGGTRVRALRPKIPRNLRRGESKFLGPARRTAPIRLREFYQNPLGRNEKEAEGSLIKRSGFFGRAGTEIVMDR